MSVNVELSTLTLRAGNSTLEITLKEAYELKLELERIFPQPHVGELKQSNPPYNPFGNKLGPNSYKPFPGNKIPVMPVKVDNTTKYPWEQPPIICNYDLAPGHDDPHYDRNWGV